MDQTPTATCPPRPPDIDALHHLDLHTMTCPEPPNDSPYYTGWWDRADVQGIESSSQKPTEKAHDDAENQGPQHWKIWKDLKNLKRSEKIWVIVWGFGRNQRFWTWFVQGCLVNISMESWKCPANKGCRYNLDQLAPAPANSADMVRCFDNGCLVLQNRSSTTS